MISETDISALKLEPKILYLTKVYPYPPALAGDAVYSRGIIEALSSVSKLTVLCCDNGGSRHSDSFGIDWRVIGEPRSGRVQSVFSKLPLISWRFATREFDKKLVELLRDSWQAIILDNIGLIHALPRALKYRENCSETKIIYISHEYEYPTRSAKYDSYGMGFLARLASALDLSKIKAAEDSLLRCSDIVTVINASDIAAFKKISPAKKYHVLLPGYNGPILKQRTIDVNTPRRVLLLGGRRSEQKRKILLDWLDISYERFIERKIEMIVAGDMDEVFRSMLAERFPAVRILGFVDDLKALVESARMGVIADTVGGGFKLRLLSHVFERLPIVGLADAIAGLPTVHGRGYLGAQDMPDLLKLVCSVIDDTEKLNELQNHAFSDCLSEFSWSNRGASLAHVIVSNHYDDLL